MLCFAPRVGGGYCCAAGAIVNHTTIEVIVDSPLNRPDRGIYIGYQVLGPIPRGLHEGFNYCPTLILVSSVRGGVSVPPPQLHQSHSSHPSPPHSSGKSRPSIAP